FTLSHTAASTTQTYTLSLHDALPIYGLVELLPSRAQTREAAHGSRTKRSAVPLRKRFWLGCVLVVAALLGMAAIGDLPFANRTPDRKSTRLNSSHLGISYAVFCLKKK